jgi:ACS family tartrate transporter-like MFS transporter
VWRTAVPLALTAATLAATLLTDSLAPTIAILCLAVTGTYAIKGPFWALSTECVPVGNSRSNILVV